MMRAPDTTILSRQLIFVANQGYRIVDDTSPTVRNSVIASQSFSRFLGRVLPLGPVPLSFVIED